MDVSLGLGASGGERRMSRLARASSRHRRLLLPLGLCLVLVLIAIIGPIVAPFPPNRGGSAFLEAPGGAHWLGTDQTGRDVLSRMLAGTRVSMTVGVGSVLVGLLVGTLIGIVAGIRSNSWVDSVLMRLMDLVLALPVLVIASVMAGITGDSGADLGPVRVSNQVVLLLIIAMVLIPTFARLARAATLAETREEYVVAARASGLKRRHIILAELLPNVLDPLIVQAALSVGAAISAEAALSFLGLGIQPPNASWGNILRDGQQQLLLGAWWLIVFPTAAIAVSTYLFVLLGDRLRDELDPRAAARIEAKPAGVDLGLSEGTEVVNA